MQPNSTYTASAWAKTVDLAGQGFGVNAGDTARLVVAELAADGRVLAEHSSASATIAAPYQRLDVDFTTSAETARLRLLLDTVIACTFEQGHVAYDDCVLTKTAKK